MECEGEGSSSSNSCNEPPSKKSKISQEEITGENEPTQETNYISKLPHEVLLKIFKHLDFKTISRCAILCRSFNNVSNDGSLYSNVILKHTMEKAHLDSYTSKIARPKKLRIEYKFYDKREQAQNYAEFNKYVIGLLTNCGEHLTSLVFESCRSEEVLQLLSKCPNLISVNFLRCKASFEKLPMLQNLTRVSFLCSDVPNSIINDTLKNNRNLRVISLSDNINLYINVIAETIGEYNSNVQALYFCEKRMIRAKGLRALARCNKLRVLSLTGGPYDCDPEDSLQQLAAGCPLLEKLSIYGWKGISDENLLPVLQGCTQLKKLDLRGLNITIKSCREAALSLPKLKSLDVYKCHRIKKAEKVKLQRDFPEIDIAVS